MKNVIKRLIIRTKFFRKKITLGSCNLDIHSVFEGYNKIGNKTVFKGSIGAFSYIGDNSNLSAKIGRFCSIGSNVCSINGFHPSSIFISTHPFFYSDKSFFEIKGFLPSKFQEHKFAYKNLDICIGNDVWIGSNVLIFAGVSIGDGSIIGAGSVVTKDVEPYSVVCGIPSKEIKKRFTENDIQKLLKIQWWNKEIGWIIKNKNYFENKESFFKKVDK